MAHVRKTLRSAVEAAITGIAGLTVLRPNVREVSSLPCVRVMARQEAVSERTYDGDDRLITLVVIVNDQTTEDVDDLMDDWAAAVEPAVLSDAGVAAVVASIEYTGAELAPADFGKQASSAVALTFEAVVQTPRGNPETIIT